MESVRRWERVKRSQKHLGLKKRWATSLLRPRLTEISSQKGLKRQRQMLTETNSLMARGRQRQRRSETKTLMGFCWLKLMMTDLMRPKDLKKHWQTQMGCGRRKQTH